MVADSLPRMTHAEYAAFVAASPLKYEYLRGELFAMAGGSFEHARLAARMIAELSVRLAGKPCAPFSSDLRVRVEATDFDTFPDVTVICGALQAAADDPNAAINPSVLVEVLSDSTEAYDRGEKFAHYRRIDSLREYLLVSQRSPRLESFRRNPNGTWTFEVAGPGERLRVDALDIELDVDTLYASPLG